MIGFAGEELPRFVFPTIVGYQSISEDTSECYIGQELLNSTPLRVAYPMKAGIVEDWTALKAIVNHSFHLLEINPCKSRILLTKPLPNPQQYQRIATQMLFHEFGVGFLTFVVREALPMIAIRRRTGFVIDCEPEYVSIVPIHDHLVISHAAEILSSSETTGLEIPLITKQIDVSLSKIDSNIHETLCKNMVLIGSSTTRPDFDSKLLKELQTINPSRHGYQIESIPERLYLPWKGGSVFGMMHLFNEIGISISEFEKKGPEGECKD